MKKRLLPILAMFCMIVNSVWADGFTVERAVNLGQLDSWTDISKFQWQEIDHGVLDNREEMDALKTLFYDPSPKDTVGFYNQIYKARDNQYIVLRLDKAQGNRPFHIRVTCIKNTTDPSKNRSKVFSADKYCYIMPPIGENQLEVKIWPQGEGEEKAKAFIFNSHSYGSASLRTVMLDKSRIVEGNYTLQLIYYNPETEKSDTTYIKSLQVDKLYSFYDYDDGDLKEAYLMVDNFKRIKLKHDWWAMDAVTHVNDNSVSVMSGPKMPYPQHKRLDAPNPTYLDSRLFSHHDTLWVNLYLDNTPSDSIEGLTMHALRSDTDNKIIGNQLLDWGKDPVSNRLYVLTDGEPCLIECYRDKYLPKLSIYPGSYNHATGIIEGDREEIEIHLESSDPVTSPKTSSVILSTLTTTNDCRGSFYVSKIQSSDIVHELLTETINYDEYASHKDTAKFANGVMYTNYAEMVVAIVTPSTSETNSNITLKKVHNDAEENDIQKETLQGESTPVHHELFDYNYWTTVFNLCEYIPITKSGRPAIAFDDEVLRQLPILCNKYIDMQKLAQDAEAASRDKLESKDAGEKAGGWITDVAPDATTSLNVKIPLEPPFYFRLGVDADFFKAKKVSVWSALGVGYEYDFVSKKSSNVPVSEAQEYKVTMGTFDDYGDNRVDMTPSLAKLGAEPKNFKKKDPNAIVNPTFNFNAFAEVYQKYSVPVSLKGDDWKQWLTGMQWLDEAGVRAEVDLTAGFGIDFINMLGAIGGKSGKPNVLSDFQKWVNGNGLMSALNSLFGPSLSAGGGVRLFVNAGLFSFDNTEEDGWGNPLKNHILAFRFIGQAYINAALRAKIDAFVAGAEVGVSAGAGVTFKYSAGSRLDFDKDFSGSAWSWYAGMGAYYKVKFFGWSKHNSWDIGNIEVKQKLIKPKDYKNPFHKDFNKYLSGAPDPEAKSAQARRTANSTLPGDFVIGQVDFTQPVKFISGGDSIIYQGAYESPNDYTVEIASTGEAIYLTDNELGGCTDYDAASVPGTDLVVLEQATGKIAKEDLEDSLHLDETVKRASRVYSVYYTKKKPGTKWYSPKPVYSSTETTSYRPRVALADNGTGVAIWQEGTLDKGSWVTDKDTVKLADIVMNGQLMLSRFDGNETWSAPIPVQELNENYRLKDYRVTYDGQTAFIVARKVGRDIAPENVCFTVDAAGTVTSHQVEQSDELMQMRRIGDNNVMAWVAVVDTASNTKNLRVQSFGMDGNAKKGINASLMLENVDMEDYAIIPDLEAKSLDNVAILWRERVFENDSTTTKLMTARLVPNRDGTFGMGTPIVAVQMENGNSIYGFDGYMSDDKIQVCYVAVDSLGKSQLNKIPTYFGNAFGYTVQFDNDHNQGFQCAKDSITLLVTINNFGTSTITGAVMTVKSKDLNKQYPFDVHIPAGSSSQERIIIPYQLGSGVNTTLLVQYDDVLKAQNTSNSRGSRRSENAVSPTYERKTATFYPYHPRLECFVAAQHVDKNGDNHITICVRNYARRSLKGDFAVIVGLKDYPYSSIVYNTADDSHMRYETKTIYSLSATDVPKGSSRFYDFGSYCAGYVTLTVPAVTEKKELFVGATLVYKDPTSGHYVRVSPSTYSGSDNSGVATLYPSSEVVAIDKVYNNNDKAAQLHVSQRGNTLVVTGAKPRHHVRLYQSNGVVIARQVADDSGQATFSLPYVGGVGLVSSDKETVKFTY